MNLQNLTIQNWLGRNATYRPEHLAIVFKEKRLTYFQLNQEINRLIRAFQAHGLRKGDKIATCLPNTLELFEVYWACAKMGAVAVPLSPLLRGAGLTHLIQNSDAKLLITNNEMTDHLRSIDLNNILPQDSIWTIESDYSTKKNNQSTDEPTIEKVSGNDPYNIIYSSGTTGSPKGIVISHAARALYGSVFANSFRMTPESIALHSGSIVFNGSFLTMMPAMYQGATFILEDSFKPKTLISTLQKEKVTHTILVPSQIMACLHEEPFHHGSVPSLEYILSVGAPLLSEHKQELNRRMPNIFYELYGLTEGFMTILDKTQASRKAGSVGVPPPFMSMRIVDDQGQDLSQGQIGEIVGQGPMMMTEYYKNPELTAETIRDGWLYSGDLGFVDDDGFLHLTGRKKDLIISGGVNVYPVDIEEVLATHPQVQDVAVFGIPHSDWGEVPVAAVVVKSSDADEACTEKMRTWVNERLHARYQKVHQLWIVEQLPRNVAGKVLKRDLKNTFLKT